MKFFSFHNNKYNFLMILMVLVILGGLIYRAPQIVNHIRSKRQLAQERAKIKILNLYMPTGKFAGRDGQIEYGNIVNHLDYYLKVAEYIPDLADVHGILGICYFHQGEKDKAINEFLKAIELNPTYFWFHYNLGMIYLSENRIMDAGKSFEIAYNLPPNLTLKFISSSKLLSDLLNSIEGRPYPLGNSLREGYKRASYLFNLCLELLTRKSPFPIESLEIKVQLF